MQVLDDNTQNLNRTITITINSEKLSKAIEKELINMSKTIRINGFRQGKVPMQIIFQRYKNSIVQDTLNKLMKENFINIMIKQKINVIDIPIYTPGTYIENSDFTYTVEFKVYPIIKLKFLEEIKVEKPLITISDYDINTAIDVIRQQNIKWIKQDTIAQKEDRVTIDFISYIDGKKIKDGKISDFILILGKGHMIPNFEDNIIGYKPGDKFNINSNFPKDYHLKFLRGKTVNFDIKLKKVEKPIFPELNKSFIDNLGIKDGSVSSLRNIIHKNMELESKSLIYKSIKNQIVKEILQLNIIEIPIALVNHEIDVINYQSLQERKKNKKLHTDSNLPRKSLENKAKKRIIIKLLINNISNQYKLETDEKIVNKMIEEIASIYKDPQEIINLYKNNDDMINNIRYINIEKQSIDIVLSQAKVIEKEIDFNTLVSQFKETTDNI
ncbi:trigger factor [Candidatus Pantoea edessiphila]|nr:trigger factor [Candidatus Pantoea edessiphila]